MYLYVCEFIGLHACYSYIHVCMYLRMYMNLLCMYVCIHICMYVSIYKCMYVFIYTFLSICLFTRERQSWYPRVKLVLACVWGDAVSQPRLTNSRGERQTLPRGRQQRAASERRGSLICLSPGDGVIKWNSKGQCNTVWEVPARP